MALSATQSVGASAENLALQYLQAKGLRVLQRNFHCRFGEVDLVMLDRQCLVFVEVRYRAKNRFSTAAHSISSTKQNRIIRTACIFVSRNRRYAENTMRFDVVAIDSGCAGESTIQWMADAFRPRN